MFELFMFYDSLLPLVDNPKPLLVWGLYLKTCSGVQGFLFIHIPFYLCSTLLS